MIRSLLVSVVLAGGIGAVLAQSDPVKERQAIMKANGRATGALAAMNKGDQPFDLDKVKASLQTFVDASQKMPMLFPESTRGVESGALPAAYDNKADFDARFAKFGADATAAMGKITDLASLKTSIGPVLGNCGGCHELYRKKS